MPRSELTQTRFTSIPAVSQAGLSPTEYATISALKENVELLIGSRGGKSDSGRAIVKGQLTVTPAVAQKMTRVTAEGAGFTVSNVNVPSLSDYIKLAQDVQLLANDLANLRNTVNTLIAQLKA